MSTAVPNVAIVLKKASSPSPVRSRRQTTMSLASRAPSEVTGAEAPLPRDALDALPSALVGTG